MERTRDANSGNTAMRHNNGWGHRRLGIPKAVLQVGPRADGSNNPNPLWTFNRHIGRRRHDPAWSGTEWHVEQACRCLGRARPNKQSRTTSCGKSARHLP